LRIMLRIIASTPFLLALPGRMRGGTTRVDYSSDYINPA